MAFCKRVSNRLILVIVILYLVTISGVCTRPLFKSTLPNLITVQQECLCAGAGSILEQPNQPMFSFRNDCIDSVQQVVLNFFQTEGYFSRSLVETHLIVDAMNQNQIYRFSIPDLSKESPIPKTA